MTKSVDTAFERHFSEPPVVAVKEGRTHCEACKEPLNPDVMHKCHGNKEHEPPVFSSTEITEICPRCKGEGALIEREVFQGLTYVVVCKTCRVYVWPEVSIASDAIRCWNSAPRNGTEGWPVWLADMPGDDTRANVIQSETQPPRHPDLRNYKGVCPECKGTGQNVLGDADCDDCAGTGVIE